MRDGRGAAAADGVTAVPQSTTKSPPERKAVPQSTAKRAEQVSPGPRFAVLSEDDDIADGFDDFAGLDAKVWRIERRYRLRKDGAEIMYWNYRRRKIHHDADGNRRIEYRKGGSRIK